MHWRPNPSFVCRSWLSGSVDAVVLMVGKNILSFFSKDDERLLELLCRQAGMALENVRLMEEMNQRLQEINYLLEFSRQLGSLDPLSILRSLVDSALKAISPCQCWNGCAVASGRAAACSHRWQLDIVIMTGC